MFPRRRRRPYEETGADDGADAKGDEAPDSQSPFEALFLIAGLGKKHI
jgi:hypothetical protein